MFKIEEGREGVQAILNELRIANFPELLISSLICFGIPIKKFVQLYYFCAIIFTHVCPLIINSGCKT